MSTSKFDIKTRVSLWRANERRCFFCSEVVSFGDLEIDHIVPERLTSEELTVLANDIPLPSEFDLNGLCNLVPTHRTCNSRKGGRLLDNKAMVFFLQLWSKKQGRVHRELQKHTEAAERDRHLIAISALIESGEMTKHELMQFVSTIRPSAKPKPIDPLVVSFGANVAELIAKGLPSRVAGKSYLEVCDFLETDLLLRVSSTLPILAQQCEASSRNGETLSVRIAFWNLDLDRLDQFAITPWEIMEIVQFSELYDFSPADLLSKAVVKAHANIVCDPWDPGFGIGRCPQCGSTKLSRSSATDHEHDETYYTIECDECGWSEWTQ